ncbi:MAG: sulfotransferase [Angustibacter sp.]
MTEPARLARMTSPPVIFIAGSGRSGSTLLERVLAGIPGFSTVGELLDLPRKVAPHNEICGCSRPFADCPFWAAVGRAVDWDADWFEHTRRLQVGVARQRFLPRLLTAAESSDFGRRTEEYAERYRAVITAVADEAARHQPADRARRAVVDASKWPVLAQALRRGGVDIRVIHLIRDVRGVAHSLSKSDIVRPHSAGEVMFHNSPAGAAARWLTTQSTMDLLAQRGLPVARLAYADFVDSPLDSLRRVLSKLDLPVFDGDFAHVRGSEVTLAPSHGLSGNPTRFRHGVITLRPDDRWRAQMRRRDRLVATAIGAPQLVRLNSITRSRRPESTPVPGGSSS